MWRTAPVCQSASMCFAEEKHDQGILSTGNLGVASGGGRSLTSVKPGIRLQVGFSGSKLPERSWAPNDERSIIYIYIYNHEVIIWRTNDNVETVYGKLVFALGFWHNLKGKNVNNISTLQLWYVSAKLDSVDLGWSLRPFVQECRGNTSDCSLIHGCCLRQHVYDVDMWAELTDDLYWFMIYGVFVLNTMNTCL